MSGTCSVGASGRSSRRGALPHRLRLAVLGHDKVARRKALDRFAVLVFHADGRDHEFGAASEGGLLGGARCDQKRREDQSDQHAPPQRTRRARRHCFVHVIGVHRFTQKTPRPQRPPPWRVSVPRWKDLEPQPRRRLHPPHHVGLNRQSELRAADDDVDARVGDAVQQIHRVQPPIERQTIVQQK